MDIEKYLKKKLKLFNFMQVIKVQTIYLFRNKWNFLANGTVCRDIRHNFRPEFLCMMFFPAQNFGQT